MSRPEPHIANPFEPQLPSWLDVEVPLRIGRDVIPLICGLDFLPEAWAKRMWLSDPENYDAHFKGQPTGVNCVKNIIKGARPFPPPHWTGDARPTCVWFNATINIPTFPETSDFDQNILSNNPPKEFWIYLVRDLGYPIESALTSFGIASGIQTPDRRRRSAVMNEEWDERLDNEWDRFTENTSIPQPEHPYIVAPIRYTKRGGGFTRDSVLQAVARMRASHKMRMACFEVVFNRRSPTKIAGKFGVGIRALNKAASRVRNAIRGGSTPENGAAQEPNVYAASEALMGIS